MSGGWRSSTAILRRPDVQAETGLSRSTLYLRIKQGLWTQPVNLGGRTVGWPAREVHALNAARIAGKSDSHIRGLVLSMEAARAGESGDSAAAQAK
jgi:prophage regulatory protein